MTSTDTQSNLKLLIFDFDGTIADTLPTSFELLKKMAPKYNVKMPQTYPAYQKLMEFSVPQILWRLRIPPFKLKKLIQENQQLGIELLKKCQPFPGIPEALATLSQKYTLTIATSNFSSAVQEFLAHYTLTSYFSDVLGTDTHKDKAVKMKMLMKKFEATPSQTLVITDSLRDLKDAQKVRAITLAVSYGIHSRQTLSSLHPTFIVDSPAELIKTLL
jgi:phosphoglycolate phosphatase-like HAD superfamily hydrolase